MVKKLPVFLFYCFYLAFTQAQDQRGDTINIRSYVLQLNFTDFTNKTLYGNAQIGVKAKVNGVNTMRLDLQRLTVDSIKVNNQPASYSHNDTVINLVLPLTLNTGDSATLNVFYHGNPVQPAGDFGGFYWTNQYAFNIGVSFLSPQHCFGRVWFPCFDNFTERSFYEFYITTKNNHKAFCNGTLLDSVSHTNTNVWHWKLEEDIPSYLASVAVSDYQTLQDTVQGINGVVPIQLAARAQDTSLLKNRFVHLHDAFHIQEGDWGAYPWERVGFCMVPFNSGAMEHATNIAYMLPLLNSSLRNAEETMAHELSHHWFGNLVTCKEASDMWLNEGWAVYNEKLFIERLYGDSVYNRSVLDNHEYVLRMAHRNDGSYLPVSPVPSKNTYGTTVYRKGGDMIHTLRYYMGDSLFFHCVRSYLSDFAFQDATTVQLRNYVSQCSGINLADYFNDWILSPGFSHFSIDWFQSLPALTDGFVTELVIRQKLNNGTHFYNNVPVTVSYFDINGNRTDETVSVRGECTSHTSRLLVNEPVYIAVDFDSKLQDAITDEWKIIKAPGTYDFNTAKMVLTVSIALDRSLVRIEHNWVRPEPMQDKIQGLHLHDKRYWTVDGIFEADLKANARIDYDGMDPSLDAAFFTNTEDSLVVMYRANSSSEWVIADSFKVNMGALNTDKRGNIAITGIKKGQYCLAIWNSANADTSTADAACAFVPVDEIAATPGFQLYPNPAEQQVNISFATSAFVRVELFDVLGKKILERKITGGESSVQLNLTNITPGYYLTTLTTKAGARLTKKLVKE